MTSSHRFAAVFVIFVGVWLSAADAHAYPWVIKVGHTNCAQCHADPSGGGLLTEYGRGQGEILLRMVYGKRDLDWEPGKQSKFAFGAVDLPKNVLLGVSSRSVGLGSKFESGAESQGFLQMQLDLRGQVTMGKFRGYGSVAFAPFGALPASLTSNDVANVISREHWIGWDASDAILVRGGRIALPYGLRLIEHTLFARNYTQTDINSAQQHGVSVAYNQGQLRGELMAIAGNFQVRPDQFRERGYSGFAELTVMPRLAVGVSSLVAASQLDITQRVPRVRQAHGTMARLALSEKVVAMAEVDALLEQLDHGRVEAGHTGFLMVDYEPVQGLHFKGTGEWLESPGDQRGLSSGFWLSTTWFFYSHMDLRLDLNTRNVAKPGGGTTRVDSGLLHFHIYL